MESAEDIAVHFGAETTQQKKQLRHPLAVLFHLTFRVAALLTYLFCGWFSNSFITCFVFIVLLLSMDFWTVKNITGRLLVGLRWWNYVDDSGKSNWVFESRKKEDAVLINTVESQVFWISLVLSPVLWFALLFLAFFGMKFKWFMLVCIALTLNGANLYGYMRCKLGDAKEMRSAATGFLGQKFFKNVMDTFSAKKEGRPVMGV